MAAVYVTSSSPAGNTPISEVLVMIENAAERNDLAALNAEEKQIEEPISQRAPPTMTGRGQVTQTREVSAK